MAAPFPAPPSIAPPKIIECDTQEAVVAPRRLVGERSDERGGVTGRGRGAQRQGGAGRGIGGTKITLL